MIRDLLAKYQIRLNRDLGQHFLTANSILERIVSSGNVTTDDLVIEIGTGVGTLTKPLAQKAGFVVTIEMDRKLIPAATEYLTGLKNIEIINEDAMKVDFIHLYKKYGQYKNIKIISNLPYYITSPLIAKFLEAHIKPKLIIVTIQKEVAKRIVSAPGNKEYGSFSIFVNYYTKPKIVFNISKKYFIPNPEVESSVLKLDVLSSPSVKAKNEKLFFKIVHAAFQQRRKMLHNAILNANITGITKEALDAAFVKSGIDSKRRGETLSIDEFAKLSDHLS